MPRKPSPFYHTAILITDRLCPNGVSHPGNRETTLNATMAALSRLCGDGARKRGWPVYDLTLVYLSWMALCDRAVSEDWGNLPSLEKVTKSYTLDRLPWIEHWPKTILSDMPPVWDSKAHDDYIREHHDMLRLVGFQYKGWSTAESQFDGSRLTYSEVEAMGLLPK